MKKLLGLLLLSSFALFAGDLTGKWSGKFDITNSDGEVQADSAYMNLKLEGTTVTGTAGPSEDQQWAIKSGKLAEGRLTFKVDMEDGGSIEFDLVFDGDAIRGNAAGTGNGGEKLSAKVDLHCFDNLCGLRMHGPPSPHTYAV
jgi:hypothetical protein